MVSRQIDGQKERKRDEGCLKDLEMRYLSAGVTDHGGDVTMLGIILRSGGVREEF